MLERASLWFCAGIGVWLAACQLNDTDSAPPAPATVEGSEPNTSQTTSSSQAGGQGDGEGDGEGDEMDGVDGPGDTPAGDGSGDPDGPPLAGIDAGSPPTPFPGLDGGGAPPSLQLDASTLIPTLDAGTLNPGNLALPDGSVVGPLDAGLALND